MLLVMPKPVSAKTLRQVMKSYFYYNALPEGMNVEQNEQDPENNV